MSCRENEEMNVDNRIRLHRVEIKGFKSIGSAGQTIDLKDINVMLGANGSGKSNLISFFNMISFLSTQAFQTYVANQGFADSILHYGSKQTEKIEFKLDFEKDGKATSYRVKLSHGLPDQLFFAGEEITFMRNPEKPPQEYCLEGGSKESGLHSDERPTSKVLLAYLRSIRHYQFHDTSSTAKIRNHGYKDDSKYLRSDAGNLAAFLRGMRESPENKPWYDRIIRHIGRIMPQFGDFEIDPLTANTEYVRLNWKEKNSDYLFGPHQISDGSLRFIALTAALMQPPDMLPNVIVLDEPELGLHPAAMSELAGMIKAASTQCQVIVATQSTRLVDEFDLDNIIVVETQRKDNFFSSEYEHLEPARYTEWLERYCMSELWEKNVLGGRP